MRDPSTEATSVLDVLGIEPTKRAVSLAVKLIRVLREALAILESEDKVA